jgi:tetraacyldisaccharide 4'-kinase
MRPHPIRRAILWPFSMFFAGAVLARAALYRAGILPRRGLRGIVISVGNLTAGGTGKTPMVIWLARRIAASGGRVGILTRGYRSVTLPAAGDGASAAERLERTSDEVVVLRSHLGDDAPVAVGKNRYREGCRLEEQGVEWFVLDDGFQHLGLARDVDIVLIDASAPFDGGRLLPAGRLREPRSALARADLVVITRSDAAPALETLLRRYTSAPVFYAQTELVELLRIHPEPLGRASENERARRLFAFCAIGNPGAFFRDLRRWGIHVAGEASFPDHHLYSQRNADELEEYSRQVGARGLVCTEKDILNFRDLNFHDCPVYVCRIALRPSDPDGFWQAIVSTVERKRAGEGQ